jgi:hypothetical protein
MTNHINREALKNQALLERVSNLTAEYENKVADLRVELTVVGEQLREATEKLESNGLVPEEAEADAPTDAAE